MQGGSFQRSEKDLVTARCEACAGDVGACLGTYAALLKKWRQVSLPHVLRRGGFACRWGLAQSWRFGHLHVHGDALASYAFDHGLHASFDGVCGVTGEAGDSAVAADVGRASKTVVVVLHNEPNNYQQAVRLQRA